MPSAAGRQLGGQGRPAVSAALGLGTVKRSTGCLGKKGEGPPQRGPRRRRGGGPGPCSHHPLPRSGDILCPRGRVRGAQCPREGYLVRPPSANIHDRRSAAGAAMPAQARPAAMAEVRPRRAGAAAPTPGRHRGGRARGARSARGGRGLSRAALGFCFGERVTGAQRHEAAVRSAGFSQP